MNEDDFDEDDIHPFVKATIVSALMLAAWLVLIGLVSLLRLACC